MVDYVAACGAAVCPPEYSVAVFESICVVAATATTRHLVELA